MLCVWVCRGCVVLCCVARVMSVWSTVTSGIDKQEDGKWFLTTFQPPRWQGPALLSGPTAPFTEQPPAIAALPAQHRLPPSCRQSTRAPARPRGWLRWGWRFRGGGGGGGGCGMWVVGSGDVGFVGAVHVSMWVVKLWVQGACWRCILRHRRRHDLNDAKRNGVVGGFPFLQGFI